MAWRRSCCSTLSAQSDGLRKWACNSTVLVDLGWPGTLCSCIPRDVCMLCAAECLDTPNQTDVRRPERGLQTTRALCPYDQAQVRGSVASPHAMGQGVAQERCAASGTSKAWRYGYGPANCQTSGRSRSEGRTLQSTAYSVIPETNKVLQGMSWSDDQAREKSKSWPAGYGAILLWKGKIKEKNKLRRPRWSDEACRSAVVLAQCSALLPTVQHRVQYRIHSCFSPLNY
jgi:hypothetical protein